MLAGCVDYTASMSEGLAVATCAGTVSAGPLEGPLTPIPELSAVSYFSPRLAPEGDELLVSYPCNPPQVVSFRRSDDSWIGPSPWPLQRTIGAPSRGSTRRVISGMGATTLGEYEIVNGMTSELVRTYSVIEWGLVSFHSGPFHLSPDGLRMVYSDPGSDKQYYSDRNDLSEPLRPAVPIADLTDLGQVFLDENCERLYFSALGQVLYLSQQTPP
jgi:hypothetical protein